MYSANVNTHRRNCVFAVLAALSATGTWGAPSQRTLWARAPIKPTLLLPRLEGDDWRLASYKGQVVLLNFWASWCSPCRAEMPALEDLLESHAHAGLHVVGVNYREPLPAIQSFVTQTTLRIPVVRDADGTLAKSLGVHIFPTTIAIDRRGRTRFAVIGECDWRGAEAGKWVADLLAE